jgi:hypothetical protein
MARAELPAAPGSPPDPARPRIGIGVLSWHGYDTLAATLASYRDNGLLDLVDERVVFLPEQTERGIAVAREFDMPYAGSRDNLGIMGGLKALAQCMTSEFVILLENDYRLIENQSEVARQLARASADILSGEVKYVQLRHLNRPGEPHQVSKVIDYFGRPGQSRGEAALVAARRFLRPGKAAKLAGRSVYLWKDADRRWPKAIGRTASGNFRTSSRHLNWSNNPSLIPRRFFLEEVVAAAEQRPARRLVNGFPTLEIELNCRWWRKQDWPIGIAADGLFSQIRLGDRGY